MLKKTVKVLVLERVLHTLEVFVKVGPDDDIVELARKFAGTIPHNRWTRADSSGYTYSYTDPFDREAS